ncbi:VOC family protein [Salibacterium halotolerans]|uniref:Catechol 2,3-dioxygenase n=1 Tax=Salibacterium halotolerans TaxID=1884432 RepID=A0A1I5VC73_9BACI|nr:VOC family protein [Salibacterium halotolerans]SFQ04526.1 catechol 2,3-dioxygenase [Salibacterium halotolerans]
MSALLPDDAGIGSVVFTISDLEQSLSFYEELLGFQVIEKTPCTAKLSADGKHPLIVLEEREDAIRKPLHTTGLYHTAVLLPDRTSLGMILRRLVQHDYPLQGAADHHFSEAVYLPDPDGNGLELYRDRDRSQWTYDDEGWIYAPTVPLDADAVLQAAEGKEWQGMPAATIIGHIHLHVGDLEETKAFYVSGLGFSPMVHMGDHALFVAAGGYHHHIGLNIWAGRDAARPPENAVGLKEYTITMRDGQKLDEVRSRLQKAGIVYDDQDGDVRTRDTSGSRVRLAVR